MWAKVFFQKSWWWIFGISLLTTLAFAQKINLPTADLGRHLRNGQLVWSQGLSSPILNQNYYSYTNPEFTFPNHHWLYGVIIWPIWQVFGFAGLSWLNLSLMLLSLILVLTQTQDHSKKIWLATWFLSLPLIINRTEVRPENFSLFFTVFFIFLLERFKQKRLSGPVLLLVLCLVELLWTNLHLFFGLGLILVGWYWFQAGLELIINRDKTIWRHAAWLGVTLLAITLITLINPNGKRGAMVPLTIFDQYQYPIAENQPTFFFLQYYPDRLLYWYYLGFVFFTLLNLGLSFRKNQVAEKLGQSFLLIPLALAGLLMIRLYPFIALILLPVNVKLLGENTQFLSKRLGNITYTPLLWSLLSFLIFGGVILTVASGLFLPNLSNFGLGASQKSLKAGEFLKELPVAAHIFNNYDVGGYLILQAPSQKVFVDNRPEFYPAEFMQNIYVASQKDEKTWQKVEEEYHLDVIFFYRHDATDWAQPFLIKRLKDQSWIPVYVDEYFLCLAKDNQENQALIKKYRLPTEIFSWSNL